MRRWLTFFVELLLLGSLSFSEDLTSPTHHVSQAVPVDSRHYDSGHYELSAERAQSESRAVGQPDDNSLAAPSNTWQLLAPLPGAISDDISSPTAKIGSAAGELGLIWKTIDGGSHWTQVLSA